MALFRQFSSLRSAQGGSIRALFSAHAAPNSKFYDVPEGHADADLSQTTCNIGLNRRRDLSLGGAGLINIVVDGKPQKLSEIFKGKKSVIFGVPDCGKVCSEQHVPGFLKAWDELRKNGISQIFCIAVSDPAAAVEWGKKVGADGSKIVMAADPNQAATRMLGMELGDPQSTGPRSLRYAAIVDDGVILKVKVDKSPGEVKESSAASILETLKTMFH